MPASVAGAMGEIRSVVEGPSRWRVAAPAALSSADTEDEGTACDTALTVRAWVNALSST
ncbi:MAG: hypothetical protein OEW34_01380 [Burkholderiaceae bacterium]|nr:hypothetical protein [Burkholderiaceae bacterium]